jgi:hypothetical protein
MVLKGFCTDEKYLLQPGDVGHVQRAQRRTPPVGNPTSIACHGLRERPNGKIA